MTPFDAQLARYRDVDVELAIGLQRIRIAELEAGLEWATRHDERRAARTLREETIPAARRWLHSLHALRLDLARMAAAEEERLRLLRERYPEAAAAGLLDPPRSTGRSRRDGGSSST